MKTIINNWLVENKSHLLKKFIYKYITNKADAEDFYHDLFIIMDGKNDELLKMLYDNNELEIYIRRIIINNLVSRHSRYWHVYDKHRKKEYIDEDLFLLDNIEGDYQADEKNILLQELEDDVKDLIGKIKTFLDKKEKSNPKFFYNRQLFEKYYFSDDKQTIRGIGKLLEIPPSSIFDTITSTRMLIMKKFKTELKNIEEKIIYINTEL